MTPSKAARQEAGCFLCVAGNQWFTPMSDLPNPSRAAGMERDERYEAYVAVDASGTFSDTKREAGLLRMQQAGVIVSDYATLMVEILKDNARPEAAAVYNALDMPWATLVGQISKAYGKQSAAA